MRGADLCGRGARTRAGFATVAVLGLVAVVGLLSAGALHDALFGEQLAGSRLLHQRAAALAQLGMQDAMARLAVMPLPESRNYALQPLPSSTESVSVSLRYVGDGAPAGGFSTGRLLAQHFEIESIGHVARSIRATHVQGVVRVMPVALPANRIAQP